MVSEKALLLATLRTLEFSLRDRNQERALRMGMQALTHCSCDKGTAAAVWRRTTG